MRHRVTALALAALVGACDRPAEEAATSSAEARPRGAARPHVVVFVLDTLRADRLGCYGFERETSPALDRLANDGVLFEQVLSPCSWTRPSMGALLTSQYPRSLGLFVEQGDALPEEAHTLSEVLHEAGYHTLGLTANPNINTIFGFAQGFDSYRDCKTLFAWMRAQGTPGARGQAALPSAPELFATARELLDAAPAEQPVYLQMAFMEPHEWTIRERMPYLLREEHAERFLDDPWARYLQLTRQLTDDLGAFVDELKHRPGWRDALFVFVADHGEGLGDHLSVPNGRHHGNLLYLSQVHVPWILHREGWTPSVRRVREQARLLDVMPTLLDALDLPLPSDAVGRSWMPMLRGVSAEKPSPRIEVAETYFQGTSKIAAYAEDFVFIQAQRPQPGIDLEELQRRGSPMNGTRTNLLAAEAERASELRAFLAAWEAKHPKRAESAAARALTDEEARLLKSLGY
ncbi:MAG: sulfatase [Planctomycetes bacterium]|nr:sulfatase [Planctomycetota bacterium]